MADDELLYNFNRILLEKRDEIMKIAESKKREPIKKLNNVEVLNKDVKDTLNRIKLENERKIKSSKRYKKENQE